MEHPGCAGKTRGRHISVFSFNTSVKIIDTDTQRNNRDDRGRAENPKHIKAEVYRWIENPGQSKYPDALILYDAISDYGIQAVSDKPLSAGTIYQMNYARKMLTLYESRSKSDNWVAWANNNPVGAYMLNEAAELSNG